MFLSILQRRGWGSFARRGMVQNACISSEYIRDPGSEFGQPPRKKLFLSQASRDSGIVLEPATGGGSPVLKSNKYSEAFVPYNTFEKAKPHSKSIF